MANMDVTQRTQMESASYSGSADRIRRGSERGATVYSVIALVIGIALCYGALTLINGWWQWLVLAVLVLTTIGFMIAVSPARRG